MAGGWSSGWKRATRRRRSAKARTSAPSSTSRSLPRGWRRNWRRHAHSMRRACMGSMARAELVGRVWAKSVGRELWGGPPVRGRRPRRPARMDGTYVALARSGSGGNPRGPGIGVKIERFRPRDRRLAHKILETRFLPSATSGGRGALTLTPMPGPPAPPEHDHRNGGLIHPGALIVLLHVD